MLKIVCESSPRVLTLSIKFKCTFTYSLPQCATVCTSPFPIHFLFRILISFKTISTFPLSFSLILLSAKSWMDFVFIFVFVYVYIFDIGVSVCLSGDMYRKHVHSIRQGIWYSWDCIFICLIRIQIPNTRIHMVCTNTKLASYWYSGTS